MKPAMERGTLLLQDDIGFPKEAGFENQSYLSGWECMKASSADQLAKELNLAGWTFFYTAHEIRVTTFGFNREAMETRTAKRLIQAAKAQECNCLEVSSVKVKRWLGLCRVRTSAHTRHAQQNVICWRTHSWTAILRRCLWNA